ncbi:hypothetical protein ACHAXR_008753, partial [Thalassiosira sp. AJA248-18]
MTMNAGKQGCPCLNSASTIASLPDRQCQLPTGENGLLLTPPAAAKPASHLHTAPLRAFNTTSCTIQNATLIQSTRREYHSRLLLTAILLRGCLGVCKNKNKKESLSEERVYRSSYFSHESEVDLFYSYSTCNSTADDWLVVEGDIVGSPAVHMSSFWYQSLQRFCKYIFIEGTWSKRDSSGQIVTTIGSEYYDDTSIPLEGVYLKYGNSVMEDFQDGPDDIAIGHRTLLDY